MNIRLHSLHLKNINNISELELDLDYNIISIFGSTGSGKSSIIETIHYLFTNEFSKENKIGDYVKRGEKNFYIFSHFSIDNDNFYYEIKGGKTVDKKLVINDDFENPENEDNVFYKSDATKELEKYIDPVIISFLISSQGKGEDILFVGGAERLQKFKKLFKLDDLFKLIDSMKEDKDDCNNLIKDTETKLNVIKNLKFIKQDIPNIKESDLSELKSSLLIQEEEKQEYENQVKLYNDYTDKKEKYDEYVKKENDLLIKIYNKEDELKNYQPDISIVNYNEEEHNNIIEELNDLQIQYNNLKNEWSLYEQSLKKIQTLNQEKEKEEIILSEIKLDRLPRLDFTEEDIIKDVQKSKEIYSQWKLFESKYNAVKEGKCPTCFTEYSSDNIEEFKIEESKYKNEYIEIDASIRKRNELLQEYKKKEEENRTKQVKIDSCNKTIELYIKEIDELNNEIKKPEIDIDVIENKILEKQNIFLSYVEEKKKYEENLKQEKIIEDNRNKIQNEISLLYKEKELLTVVECPVSVDFPSEEFSYSQYEQIKKDIISFEQKLIEKNNIIEFNKKIEEQEKENNKEIINLEKIIIDNKYKLSIINESIKVIDKEFTAWLIDKGSEFIKNKMNEFFNKTYGRYEISYENDGKTIEFYYGSDNIESLPFTKASGFEKQLISVSFRVALLQLMDCNFFIGDEIDSNSANEKSLDLYKKIIDENYITQFISITHKQETQEFLKNLRNSIQYELNEGSLIY